MQGGEVMDRTDKRLKTEELNIVIKWLSKNEPKTAMLQDGYGASFMGQPLKMKAMKELAGL